jgi:hypothetical protein
MRGLPKKSNDLLVVAYMCEAAARSWKVVAEEVSREQDPQRLTKLVAELN